MAGSFEPLRYLPSTLQQLSLHATHEQLAEIRRKAAKYARIFAVQATNYYVYLFAKTGDQVFVPTLRIPLGLIRSVSKVQNQKANGQSDQNSASVCVQLKLVCPLNINLIIDSSESK